MKRLKTLMMAVMVFGLTLGLASMASAAAINCGDCHSVPPANGDNCTNTANGLHGLHYNYSSATYKKATYAATWGKCAYCHTSTTSTHSTTTHNNGYINITGNANPNGSLTTVGLSFNWAANTCANTCHRNTATAAPWGNYTSPGIKLACNSCHSDLSGGTVSLSGTHAGHLGNGATVPTYVAMNAANNAGCVNCHPDDTAEGKLHTGQPDNGSLKAYPHASDGTNVQSVNASLTHSISNSTPNNNAALVTCDAACHPRSNKLTTTTKWNGALDCNMCHYYSATPTLAGNTSITKVGMLSGSHGIHFTNPTKNLVCNDCHPAVADAAHATVLPASYVGVTFVAGLTYTGGATGNCTATPAGCHTSTIAWGSSTITLGCAACHEYPNSTNDWSASTNGHTVKYASPLRTHLRDNASYAPLTDTWAGVVGSANVNKCGLCHGGGTHMNGTGTVNMQAAPGFDQCTAVGGKFTINAINQGPGAVSNGSTCGNVKCHSGKTTPVWW